MQDFALHAGRLLLATAFLAAPGAADAQAQRRVFALGDGPWEYRTFEQDTAIRVSVVTRGLVHPWAIAFLPGTADAEHPMGDALVTEKEGRMRLWREGRLEPEPVADLSALALDQLHDVALHPDFESNGLVYFTYMKQAPRPDRSEGYWAAAALARGRFDGERLEDIEDVFVADGWRENRGGDSTRVTFASDGTLLLSSSHRLDPAAPQRLDTHIGKVLRLDEDGRAPSDNPFVGAAGALPEIYSYGHRTIMGFVPHPETGAMWELENGPHGGDEVNVLRPGANFGWPVVTFGRAYDGTRGSEQPWREGMEQPELFWVPSITVSSFAFYTGDVFPAWKNNLFVSAMSMGRLPGTGHIQRIVFNENGEIRREQMLADLHQRIRYVGQGPDGLLYLLTDETDGAVLRIAPAESASVPTDVEGAAALSGAGVETGAGEPPFAELDCSACHDVDRRAVGPSYRDIAQQYAATPENVDVLARRVVAGSVGVWGETPMAPHSGLELARAKEIVQWILRLRATAAETAQ